MNLELEAEYLGGVRPELAVLVNVFRGCFDGDELVERVHLAPMCPTGYFIKFRVYRSFGARSPLPLLYCQFALYRQFALIDDTCTVFLCEGFREMPR